MATEITSIRLATGTLGSGDADFGAEMIPAAYRGAGPVYRGIPCDMRETSEFTRASLASRGIVSDRTIEVDRNLLTRIGVGDPMGARMVIQRIEPGVGAGVTMPAAETRDVVDLRESRTGPRNRLTLRLSERRDTPDGGTA